MTRKERALRMHQEARKEYFAICDALMCPPDGHDYDYLSHRLKMRLESIDRREAEAKALDPDVDRGVVIGSMSTKELFG